MKSTMEIKFNSRKMFYTIKSFDEKVFVIEPIKFENGLGFYVDLKNGLICGESYLVDKKNVAKHKKEEKAFLEETYGKTIKFKKVECNLQ